MKELINIMQMVLVAIIHENDKVLMIKRAREPHKNKWALPGGFGALKTEKNLIKAVKKEIYGDMGVDYSPKIYYVLQTEKPPQTLVIFHGKIKGKPFVKSSETISEIKWFYLDKVLKTPLVFYDKNILKNFKKDFEDSLV